MPTAATRTIERPNANLIYFNPGPGKFAYTGTEQLVPLNRANNNFIDLTGYRQVSVFISAQKTTERFIHMGLLSGSTAADTRNLPLDENIHTFNVVAPEMAVGVIGPKNAQDTVQIWVYLRS